MAWLENYKEFENNLITVEEIRVSPKLTIVEYYENLDDVFIDENSYVLKVGLESLENVDETTLNNQNHLNSENEYDIVSELEGYDFKNSGIYAVPEKNQPDLEENAVYETPIPQSASEF